MILGSLALLIGVIGCGPPSRVSWQPVGTLVSMRHISGGWGQDEETEVVTTEGSFIVAGAVSARFGMPVSIRRQDEARQLAIGSGRWDLY